MRRLFAAFVATAALTPAAAAQQAFDYPALLQRLVDADWLWRLPAEGERCVQWSSHDRASAAGPGTPTWYANDDRGKYVRTEEREGVPEHVMVDAVGPGCVARIWSANPSGTLHFDVDGERVWSVDFARLCSGQIEGVPEPIAGVRSKGGNCYLPIPFTESLVVSATAGDLYYHVDVLQFAAGTSVPSFSPALLQRSAADVLSTARSLFVEPASFVDPSRPALTRIEVPLPCVVTGLQIVVRPTADGADLARVLAGVRLVVTEVVDGRADVLVDVPLPAFFAAGPAWRPWRGALLGVRSDRSAWSRWPMPLPFGGVLELVADGDVRGVQFIMDAQMDPRTGPSELARDVPRFRASYHQAKGTPTRPFSDHLVLDAKGRGRFVGCSLLVRNPSRVWWGEGDEKFTVDGEPFPSWFGTGTEDYFGYAWCDPTPFSAPFHAQVECQGPNNFGFTQLHRTHVPDSVPFQQSFRFELERWHWVENTNVDYATVAYWYGAPGATSGLPPVPPVAERQLERLDGPPVFVAEGALEGEELRVVRCSGGVHEVQDLGLYERTFSRDRHRWWRDAAPGDTLTLAVPVPARGRYRISAGFVQAEDFGVVQLWLGGEKVGAPFDGWAARVAASGARDLGDVALPAGEVELRLEVIGSNPKAKPRHMVGLDHLLLERIE